MTESTSPLDSLADLAVRRAVELARQQQRGALRRVVATVFVVTAAAIAATGVYVHGAGVENARYNCENFNQVATLIADFVETDASLRDKQRRLQATAGGLSHDRLRRLMRNLERLGYGPEQIRRQQERSSSLERWTTGHWRDHTVRGIKRIADVSCSAQIR